VKYINKYITLPDAIMSRWPWWPDRGKSFFW